MRSLRPCCSIRGLLSFVSCVLFATAIFAQTATPLTHIDRLTYHGWPDSLRMRNAEIEVVVVPAIGRVMSLRFLDGENVLWEDRTLDGQAGDPSGKQWVNFGGDKSWPSPEAEWKNYTGHSKWMPPPGFDGLPAKVQIENRTVVLTSPVDRYYGVRVVRHIDLSRTTSVMTIRTTYERVSGSPSKIGIWVITQLADPEAVFLPIPASSIFPSGHFVFRDTPWPHLNANRGLIRVTRDQKVNHKLGSDADRMLWVGQTVMCLVESRRTSGAEYPDRGASAEVYTNADPKTYVELETLGPLATLRPGDRIQQTNTYTLIRRPAAEAAEVAAHRVLNR